MTTSRPDCLAEVGAIVVEPSDSKFHTRQHHTVALVDLEAVINRL
jgi:hypothetical protein